MAIIARDSFLQLFPQSCDVVEQCVNRGLKPLLDLQVRSEPAKRLSPALVDDVVVHDKHDALGPYLA